MLEIVEVNASVPLYFRRIHLADNFSIRIYNNGGGILGGPGTGIRMELLERKVVNEYPCFPVGSSYRYDYALVRSLMYYFKKEDYSEEGYLTDENCVKIFQDILDKDPDAGLLNLGEKC